MNFFLPWGPTGLRPTRETRHLGRRLSLFSLIALLAVPIPASASGRPKPAPKKTTCSASPSTWQEVWGDTFQGNQLDPYSWNIETGLPGKNGEVEVNRAANIQVSGGLSILTAQNASGVISSGAINTFRKMEFRYGRVTIVAQLTKGQGIWPAFWLRPVANERYPEIDLMEELGQLPNQIYLTLHWLDQSAIARHSYTIFTGPDFSQGFHSFTMVWTPTSIQWLIDGVLRFQVTSHIPQVPMFLILDTAIGGIWSHAPTAATPFPQSLNIKSVTLDQGTGCNALPGQSLKTGCACAVVVMLVHHTDRPPLKGPYTITPQRFQADINFLLQKHVHFLTLSQFEAYEAGRLKLKGNWVLLTFDDGYASTYQYAWPILKAHHIPAALFLIGSQLNSERFWLSSSQLASMAKSGEWDIQAHTFNLHFWQNGIPVMEALTLPGIPPQVWLPTFAADTGTENALLRSFGSHPSALAFPFGYTSPDVVGFYHTHYTTLFTSDPGNAVPGQTLVPRVDLGSPTASIVKIWQHYFQSQT